MASQKVTASLQDDKGTWTIRGRVYDPQTGKMRQRTRSTGLKVKNNTKRKAEAMMKDIVAEWERAASGFTRVENPDFASCVNQWLERKKLTIRPNTLESYKVEAKAHIIPVLGKIGVCDLTRQDIQRYYERLQRDGLSVSTMKKHRVIIRGALKDAVLDDLIPVNVADNVSLPKGKKFEGKPLSEDEVAAALMVLDKQPEPVRAALTLALVFGLRREEICGLRWTDIDFADNVLHIRNTVTEFAGTVYEVENTKTKASSRDLYMIPSTAQYLKDLKAKQEKSGFALDKVCAWPDGRVVKPTYITRASMRFLKECGFEGVRLHDLRHTVATILAKRVPIKQVQEYMGHEDIQTTLSIYTHVLEADKIATSNAMAEFLKSCSESCSEKAEKVQNNVIRFSEIASQKFAEA